MTMRSAGMRGVVLAAVLVLAAPLVPWPGGNALASGQTEEQEQADKDQKKKDKEFNRDILYRHAVGPKVLAVGPYSISLFVRGQPLEAKLRVAVQTTTELARQQLETQKMAVNGIVYPLAVRMFEQGRPTADQIRVFKEDVRTQLKARYPEMIDDVFIESLI